MAMQPAGVASLEAGPLGPDSLEGLEVGRLEPLIPLTPLKFGRSEPSIDSIEPVDNNTVESNVSVAINRLFHS